MTKKTSQIHAIECYEAAIAFFNARLFAKAQRKIREYRRYVDYTEFPFLDNREEVPAQATAIIVTRDRPKDLLICLDSLKNQKNKLHEIIVVNNGGKDSLQDVVENEKLLLIEPSFPFTPSEGRNIGAFHARAELLIFLDDDAVAEPEFVAQAVKAFELYPFLGIRGRVLPKSSEADHSLAGVYDLGDYPLPALLDIEGNMAIPNALYKAVEGMNSLLFGAEGLEFTMRLLADRPTGDVYYWPKMVIRHDYASGTRLLAKRKRQAIVNEYLRTLHPHALKLKDRYTGLYRTCRKETQTSFLKRVPAKVTTFGKDMFLKLQSEKMLSYPTVEPVLKKQSSKFIGDEKAKDPSHAQINALLNRIHTIETEMEILRKSLTFRLGQLIRDSLSSPLRNGLLLPPRLFRLIKEYGNKSGFSDNAQKSFKNCGKSMKNRRQYSHPSKEEHSFTFFDEFISYRKNRNSDLRIACILNPWLYACLDFEADLIPLKTDNWREALKEKRPDFVLVQSSLEKSGDWKEYCATSEIIPPVLKEIVLFCKMESIPTVFWDTEDHSQLPLFSRVAALFDLVCAADPKSAEHYSILFNKKVLHLGPAVQPALHNPYREENQCENFTILMDGWADILESPAEFDFLKSLFSQGLHIVESRYRFKANKLEDIPAFQENIMGCMTYGSLLNALRHYRILFIPDKSLSSSLSRQWRAIEAICCGCTVIMTEVPKMEELREGVLSIRNNQELQKEALRVLNDDIGRLKQSQLARRTIYTSYTYAHRIKEICDFLGIRHQWDAFPLVSVILPTKRPEMIGACLKKFSEQIYPKKELIIVINTTDVNMENIQKIVTDFSDTRVFQIHPEKNIGVCLNFGIDQARGKYWFKMDDDDFYGPNYLTDMVHMAEAVNADIFGKPPGFIYLEDEDKIYLRNKAIQSQNIYGLSCGSFFCGATLGGRKDRFIEFSEKDRACVDTDFIENGKMVNSAMIFSDIWNFVAFRAQNKNRHTWRQGDESIKNNAAFFCDRLDFKKVMI